MNIFSFISLSLSLFGYTFCSGSNETNSSLTSANILKSLKNKVTTVNRNMLSANTATCISNTFGLRVKDVEVLRSKRNEVKAKQPSSAEVPTLQSLIDELLDNIYESDTDSIIDLIRNLYFYYPDIDHLNTLYNDDTYGGEGTLLHFAVKRKDVELLLVLKKHFLNLEARNSFNETSLMIAVFYSDLNCVRTLVHLGARVDYPIDKYPTLAHYAAAFDDIDLLTVLRVEKCFDKIHTYNGPMSSFRENDNQLSYNALIQDVFELAVEKMATKSMAYLAKHYFLFQTQSIDSMYENAISTFDFDFALVLISIFPSLIYRKAQATDSDIVMLVINRGNLKVFRILLKKLDFIYAELLDYVKSLPLTTPNRREIEKILIKHVNN